MAKSLPYPADCAARSISGARPFRKVILTLIRHDGAAETSPKTNRPAKFRAWRRISSLHPLSSLRGKFLVFLFLGGVLVAAVGAWSTYRAAALDSSEQLIDRGQGLADALSNVIASNDAQSELDDFVAAAFENKHDIERILIVAKRDMRIVTSSEPGLAGHGLAELPDARLRGEIEQALSHDKLGEHYNDQGQFFVVLAPYRPTFLPSSHRETLGTKLIGPSGAVIAIVLNQTRVVALVWRSFWRFLLTELAAVAGMVLIAYLLLRKYVLYPISQLREATARQEAGERSVRAPTLWTDEIGEVARGFNHMLDRIVESEQRLRDFAESAADWFFETDAEHRVTDRFIFNDAIKPERFAAAMGSTPWENPDATPKNDPLWAEHKATVERRGTFRNFHYTLRLADGTLSHRRMSGRPFYDDAGVFRGYRGSVTDDTGIFEAQNRAERAEARLLEAIEAIPEGFLLFDAEDRLVLANSKVIEFYDVSREANKPGVRFEDILRYGLARGQYPRGVGREEEWLAERLKAHRELDQPLQQELPGNRWILVDERRTRDGGTVGTRTDITALKARETELRHAKEAAEVANRAKSEFLSNMSHELRTPLNAIIGFSDLIAEEAYGPSGHENYRQYAVDIRDSGQHLLAVVNDILDLSKIEAGKLALIDQEIDIPAVLASATRIMAKQADAAGLSLTLELPDRLPLLHGEERALRQIMLNLLANAIKFTSAGGHVALAALLEEAGSLAIIVSDTGIGIAADDLPRAMAPFGQLENPLDRRHQGTGLGLPIAKKLTEAMGGQFDIESTPGIGTKAVLRFPAARLVEPQEALAV
jgi:two-component system cell cycle sensor histidine kinase PleC